MERGGAVDVRGWRALLLAQLDLPPGPALGRPAVLVRQHLGTECRGQQPRYPLVMGQVDAATGLLLRDTIAVIADRAPDQDERVQYSELPRA